MQDWPFLSLMAAILLGVGVVYLVMRPRVRGETPLDNQAYIIRIVLPTLAFVIVSMTIAMLHGLFDPRVDNAELFKIIGPAFQTIVGGFVGFLGGYAIAKATKEPGA